MRETPSYYAARIKELQEAQKKIYEDWLDNQHQIFERYMKEFDNLLKSMQKKSRTGRIRKTRKSPKKRSAKRRSRR